MLPWWHVRREALIGHVRAGFESDVPDRVGATYMSITIFRFCLSVAI